MRAMELKLAKEMEASEQKKEYNRLAQQKCRSKLKENGGWRKYLDKTNKKRKDKKKKEKALAPAGTEQPDNIQPTAAEERASRLANRSLRDLQAMEKDQAIKTLRYVICALYSFI